MAAPIEDPNFLRHALRHGTWERYEHPIKGSTLTLQIGQFPVLSIHAILVDGPQRPTEAFWNDFDAEMQVLLLAQLAKAQRELQIAAEIISRTGVVAAPEGSPCNTMCISMGDGLYSFICTCGARRDNFVSADAAQSAAHDHERSA